jgi:hypothetical protein
MAQISPLSLSIPFTKVMHLIERKKQLNGLAKYSKLRELQNSMNAIWTADITLLLPKNGISAWSPEDAQLYIQRI